jgi:haloacetate dehalogenase
MSNICRTSMWHIIADDLASKFTVVAPDLRGRSPRNFDTTRNEKLGGSVGYGNSSKPQGSDNHIEYSKKEMAADQVALMQVLI